MFEPRFLSREDAAAYLGVCPNTFDSEVKSGMWPPPMRRGAKLRAVTWDRRALDAAADRHSGLANPASSADTIAVPEVDTWADQINAEIAEERAKNNSKDARRL